MAKGRREEEGYGLKKRAEKRIINLHRIKIDDVRAAMQCENRIDPLQSRGPVY